MNPTKMIKGGELAEAIKDARDSFLIRQELFAVIANETKAKYDALVSAGFTADQALELCKARAI